MAFFRADAGGFVSITVGELKALLEDAFPGDKKERYQLHPNELGNLAISTHAVEGPEGPGRYYLGFVDLPNKVVRFANQEGDFPANSFLRHSGAVLNGGNDDANGPEGVALIKHGG